MTNDKIAQAILELDAEADVKGLNKTALLALLAELEGADKPTMAGQLAKYRGGYEGAKSYTGRKSLNNGDDVAHKLAGMTPYEVCCAAERICGLSKGELVAKYEHLNLGQQRMNAGNRIRGAIKREDVSVEEVLTQLA